MTSNQTRSDRGETVGDAAAVAVVLFPLWYLPLRDGGFLGNGLLVAGFVSLLGIPIILAEARRLSPRAGYLLALWGLGPLLAFAFAQDRSAFPAATLTYALMPMLVMAIRRVWFRDWAPPAILGIWLVSFGMSWYEGFIAWWGDLISGYQPDQWLALSWRNQSAAVMMVGAVGFFAASPHVSQRIIRWGLALLAAGGLTGVWFSSSRGGFAITVAALVLGALTARQYPRRLIETALVVTGMTMTLVLALSGPNDTIQSPITERSQSASTNLEWRVHHWEAGLDMFSDRPLTGHGIGAFAATGARYASPDVSLTVSAHNEFIEPWAEGGILFGLTIIVTLVSLAFLVLAAVRSPHPETTPFRAATASGAIAVVASLAAHAAIDFDWLYPLLAAHVAVAAGIVWASATNQPDTRSSTTGGVLRSVPIVLLLLVGLWGLWLESRPLDEADGTPDSVLAAILPWNAASARATAASLIADDDLPTARRILDRSRRWNPGDPDLATMSSIVSYLEGTATPQTVILTLNPERPRFAGYNLAGEVLLSEGDLKEARQVLEEVVSIYPAYIVRRPQSHAVRSWAMLISAVGMDEGCQRAMDVVIRAQDDPIVGGDSPLADFGKVAAEYCDG